MIPVQFPQANTLLAMGQDEYEPLPIHLTRDAEGRATFAMRLSPVEIEEIVRTKTLWIQQLTFGRGFQPIALSTRQPELK